MALNKIIKDTTSQQIRDKLDTIKQTIEQLPTRPLLTSINDLGDVNINNPQNDNVLKYDSATGKWINDDSSTPTITWEYCL